jgi:hypothetical protein
MDLPRRRSRIRGNQLRLTERLYIIYNSATELPACKRLHYPGSNRSDILGPVFMDAYKDMPLLSVKEKRAWWGRRRIAVGGRTGGDDDDEEADSDDSDSEPGGDEPAELELPDVAGGRGGRRMPDDTLQPVVYHGWPTALWEDRAQLVQRCQMFDRRVLTLFGQPQQRQQQQQQQ